MEFKHRPITKPEHVAIKALNNGEATPHQQKSALATIVKVLAGTNDQSYLPDNPQATAFREGRRFVGLRLLKYINTPTEEPES